MSNFYTYAVPKAIVLFVAAVVMMFSLNIWLALSMLAIFPVVMLTVYRQSREIKPTFRNVRDQFSHLNSVCEEAIGGNRVARKRSRYLGANEAVAARHVQLLQEGLDRVLEGRTSFVIAHRLSTIRHATRIMVVDRGNIQESGTHDELMAMKGEYYRLYISQYAGENI